MIRLKFNSAESRDAFADRFKLDGKVDATELDVSWHFLQFAKVDENCVDYDEVALVTGTADSTSEQEFIVKGDPAKFAGHATVVDNLGSGFYLVKTSDGTNLGDYVDSIEHNGSGVSYLATDCYIDEMNTSPVDGTFDINDKKTQWARLRVISRFRPLATVYSLNELNFRSKPELYIMDSGINFDHPEFSDPELEKVDFYTLPAFNGDFRDDVGHGTGVAACAVGKNLGITPHVKLMNVKVGSKTHNATLFELGAALDAITAKVIDDPTITRVVNMSWGIARSAWLDSKIEAMLDEGITVVCAAGNQGISVEDISPAGINDVITVGSVDKYDIPSGFNNISPTDAGVTTGSGLSLDIFAPGEEVVLASHDGGYHVGSGTSFAAPYVAGTAAGLAGLYASIVPYAQLKKLLLDVATPDALLFEDDRFSENQNKLVHYVAADTNASAKANELLSYLGVLGPDNTSLILNITSQLILNSINDLLSTAGPTTNKTTYSVSFIDPEHEKYRPYFEIENDTGKITINYPNFDMAEEIKMVMVQFTVTGANDTMKQTTPIIFFYDTNSKHKDTVESDVALALTNVNSISFYGAWGSIK